MNEDKSVAQEEHLTPAPSLTPEENTPGREGRDEEPVVVKSTEGETSVYSGLGRLPYHPNRHDRRKAAAIARKEAKKEGKK